MFWLPELHARTVILTPSLPDPPADAIVFDPDAWLGAVAARRSADGLHLLLRDGRSTHRLWLPGPPARGTAVDATLSLDATAPLRAEAAPALVTVCHGENELDAVRRALRAGGATVEET